MGRVQAGGPQETLRQMVERSGLPIDGEEKVRLQFRQSPQRQESGTRRPHHRQRRLEFVGQRVEHRGAQLLGLTGGLGARLSVSGACALQRDSRERSQCGRGKRGHGCAVQSQSANRPSPHPHDAIPATLLRVEGIRTQKVRVAGPLFGFDRRLTALKRRGRQSVEKRNRSKIESLADQSRDETAGIAGTIQQENSP